VGSVIRPVSVLQGRYFSIFLRKCWVPSCPSGGFIIRTLLGLRELFGRRALLSYPGKGFVLCFFLPALLRTFRIQPLGCGKPLPSYKGSPWIVGVPLFSALMGDFYSGTGQHSSSGFLQILLWGRGDLYVDRFWGSGADFYPGMGQTRALDLY